MGYKGDFDQSRNLQIFHELLSQLLKKGHKGEFVLIVNGKLVAISPCEDNLLALASSQYHGSLSLLQPIQEELPVIKVSKRTLDKI